MARTTALVFLLTLGVIAVSIWSGVRNGTGSDTYPIVAAADGTELVDRMQEAADAQGVCYAWNLVLDDDWRDHSGTQDEGAVTPASGSCSAGTVRLAGLITYTCSSCERSDSADVELTAGGLEVPSTGDYLAEIGVKERSLVTREDDVAWLNMVGALPLMVSSENPEVAAPPIDDTTYPADDAAPTDTPSGFGDWMRTYGIKVGLVGLLAALLLIPVTLYLRHRSRA